MDKIFICSDWHFCHNRDFVYKDRGFSTIEEMNSAIVERHNEIVDKNDEVYCLGDCILNDNDKGIECIKKLNGKIHIIRGNHDTSNRIELYKKCPNVVEVCDAKWLKYNKQMFFLSHYPSLTDNYDDNKPLNQKIISICGHSHCKDKYQDMHNGLIYHVEMDAHNCYPVLLDNIIEDIKGQL